MLLLLWEWMENKNTHHCALFSNSRSEDTEATFFAKESNSALKC